MGIFVRKRAPVGSRSGLSSTPASSNPSPKLRKLMWWRSRWCQMVPFSSCSSGCTEESLPAKSRRPGAAPARKEQVRGLDAQTEVLFLIALGRHPRAFPPRIGVRPPQPVMPVHADIAIGVKVVADGPLDGHGMVVRGNVDIADAEPPLLPVHVAPGSEARDFRHPHGAGNVAEDFIVGRSEERRVGKECRS